MSYIAKNGRLYTSGASEALTLLDDKFSVNKSYSKGDSCIYNDYLWKFTSDKPAGEWNPSVVEQCRIMDFVAPLLFNNAGAHNAIYRGKNLGTSVTTAQYNEIKTGTFDNLYIGDYWVLNGVTWRIAAFDYYLRCGNSELTTHHAVIVPDKCLYNAQMNTTNDTTGGYVAVKNRGVLTDAETAIKESFGASHILSHGVYLTNAVANGKPSGGAWVDTICDLMNEEMVYGTGILRPTSDGSTVPVNYRVEKSQLPLFAHEPSRIINRADYWLRDVVTAQAFAFIGFNGNAGEHVASYSCGVRPAFCIS